MKIGSPEELAVRELAGVILGAATFGLAAKTLALHVTQLLNERAERAALAAKPELAPVAFVVELAGRQDRTVTWTAKSIDGKHAGMIADEDVQRTLRAALDQAVASVKL